MNPELPSSIAASDPAVETDEAGVLEGELGAALRLIYQAAAEETIPAEMLDLLNKLD